MAEVDHEGAAAVDNVVRHAIELVPFAMLVADGSGQVLSTNRRWQEMTGMDLDDSRGWGWLNALAGEARIYLQSELRRVAAEGGTATCDHQLNHEPTPRWTRWWMGRHVVAGQPLVAIAAADVEDDHVRQARLYHQATHDALTGLANRSHFLESIEAALRRNERQSRRVGVVYVDLDGFKHVNDRGGHSLGDRVLLAIGARLRHAVRSADTVARIGGDEFAVLCEGLTAAEQADIVARRIEQALSESVEFDGERWLVAASVGAAVDQGLPESAESLMDRADRAMYTAKKARRPPSGPPPASPGPVPGAAGPLRSPAGPLYPAGPTYPAGATYPAGTSPDGPAARTGADGATYPAGPAGPAGPAVHNGPAGPAAHNGPAVPAAHNGHGRGPEVIPADVAELRESLAAIRGMLDQLLTAEGTAIDIRDNEPERRRL